MDFIFIEELRVRARVGVYEREKAAPQMIELNLSFGLPDAAAERDDLADTIDYSTVVERICQELEARHFNLIESLGEYVVSLLCDEFGAPWIKLRVAKIGVMKNVRRVGIYIERGQTNSSGPESPVLAAQ